MAVAKTTIAATEQTLREIEEGQISMSDPSPLQRAPKPHRNRLLRVLSKHLKAKRAFAERSKVLGGLLSRAINGLKNRELDEQARRDGEE